MARENTNTPGYSDSVIKCAGDYINDYYLYHLRLIFSQIHYTLNVGFLSNDDDFCYPVGSSSSDFLVLYMILIKLFLATRRCDTTTNNYPG